MPRATTTPKPKAPAKPKAPPAAKTVAEAAAKAVADDTRRRAREASAKAGPVLFPAESPEQIAKAVAAWWDTAGPLPVPRKAIACPVCRGAAYPRAWQVYRLPTPGKVAYQHRHPWRADISMKCHTCSAVWTHGLAITEAQAAAFGADTAHAGAAAYDWRQARDRLAGYPER